MALRAIMCATALFSCAAASAAAQEADALDADLRCLVVSLVLIGSTEPQQQQAGMGSFFYYLGRVDGARPGHDLEASLAQLAQTMTSEEISQEMVRCGSQLMTRGREVQDIGARLQNRGL